MKVTIGIVLGFGLGFLTHLVLFGRPTARQQWRVVERYNAYMRDPSNYKSDPATGLSATSPPVDPEPSLAALVTAGELSHADLVLPTVPKSHDAERHWMKFCEAHKEIVYATGNPGYVAFKTKGTEPLHLNLWFRNADRGIPQALIQDLEAKYAK